MPEPIPTREITIPEWSTLTVAEYQKFLRDAYFAMAKRGFFAPSEGIDSLELAHLLPSIPETVIAIYVAINDAVCEKGLVTPVLTNHGHNNVYAFDPAIFRGMDNVPAGTIDAKAVLKEFEPPNNSWNPNWTYVMVKDPTKTAMEGLWQTKGYIDMVVAKREDFEMLSHPNRSSVCIFVDEVAFQHPVNKSREYLADARRRGEQACQEYPLPKGMEGEFDGLVPVVLWQRERLYIATTDFRPCAHGWIEHPDNSEHAVVKEVSAVPYIAKPPLDPQRYRQLFPESKYDNLIPASGSADMTTDWFLRGQEACRRVLLESRFKG